MRKQLWQVVAAILVTGSILPLHVAVQAQPAGKSATLARDVNGFQLGMSVAEASALTPLISTGGEYFEASKDGIDYNFGVTPQGHIYRIESTQYLGRFSVDQNFMMTLRHQLSKNTEPPL